MINPTEELEHYKKLAQESAAEKARSDAMFLSIGDGVIATDQNGCITRINHVALRLLGYSKADVIGRSFYTKLIATDEQGIKIPRRERPITKALTTNQAISTRCFYRRQDGSLLAVSVTVAPIILKGQAVGAIEVFRDIGEELQIDRMKSEFISLASHQLRTPATIVKNYLSLLLTDYAGPLNEGQRHLASIAYESNERQLDIVNDLLSVASIEAASLVLKKEPIDLTKLTCQVTDLMSQIFASRQQTVTLDLSEQIIVKADASYLKMVLENLLSNASKYTPHGGAIGILIDVSHGEVRLSVADTGVGIDSRHHDKLFKKFSRIDNTLSTAVGGSGIGLYLLKQIIDLHGGEVRWDSAADAGSAFTVIFPQENYETKAYH